MVGILFNQLTVNANMTLCYAVGVVICNYIYLTTFKEGFFFGGRGWVGGCHILNFGVNKNLIFNTGMTDL